MATSAKSSGPKGLEYNKQRYPYLSNTKAPPQLLGSSPMLNPLSDHISSQRLMMLYNHLVQAQLSHGAESPLVFSGFEPQVGDYEYDPTVRESDVMVIASIPRFKVMSGMYPIKDTPYITIIYKDENGVVGYFNRYQYTMRSEGYGYKNRLLNDGYLHPGNFLPKDIKLMTSPAHNGSRYGLGVNLNTAYMAIPQVTEDAFMISETAARKLSSDGMGKLSFKILPNQIPIDYYGADGEYKFLPDVGEQVKDDGILCALRTPTPDTILYDMNKENLSQIQHLHDMCIYVPPGATIVDIDIVVNRKCKIKTPKEAFTQVQKYRDQINDYNLRIWDVYRRVSADGDPISPAFNTLVTNALSGLLIDNVKIPGFSLKATMSAYLRKAAIEFLYVTVTYRYEHKISRGFKIAGRSGNKGTCVKVVPDDEMPIDEEGNRVELVSSPISVFNRMNPSQFYEQFINRGAMLLMNRLKVDLTTAQYNDQSYQNAFNTIVDYCADCNPKWGELVRNTHPTLASQKSLVDDSLKIGIQIQITPYQKGIEQNWVKYMTDKWNITKSRVTYKFTDRFGNQRTVTTKQPIMVAPEYWFLLYKMPHISCPGIGYVNQYYSPIHANALAKMQYPISQTPIRLGEDEIRNIVQFAGPEVAARTLGMYANSFDAVSQLAEHLIFDKHPSKLDHIEMSTADIIRSNSIIGVTKHMFSCVGVDINPTPEVVAQLAKEEVVSVDENEGEDTD